MIALCYDILEKEKIGHERWQERQRETLKKEKQKEI